MTVYTRRVWIACALLSSSPSRINWLPRPRMRKHSQSNGRLVQLILKRSWRLSGYAGLRISPILIHCRAGADRTGEASAIYLMEYMDASREEALAALSFDYWHVEMFKPAKRYFIREVWQGERWARDVYEPCANDQEYDYFDKDKHCKAHKPLVRAE